MWHIVMWKNRLMYIYIVLISIAKTQVWYFHEYWNILNNTKSEF